MNKADLLQRIIDTLSFDLDVVQRAAQTAGHAEIIVDITTTGSTLAANSLKILDDGVILKSSAVLAGRAAVLDDLRVIRLCAALSTMA